MIIVLFLIIWLWATNLKNRFSERTRQIKESEEALVNAQYLSKTGDFTLNFTTGKTYWSKGMYKLLKYDENHPINYKKIAKKLHHPDDYEKVSQWLQKTIDSGENNIISNESRLVCKNGEVIYVHLDARLKYENGKAVKLFGICQDITQRKKAEIALLKSEKHFRTLMDQSPIAMQIYDKDGNLIYANHALADLWSVPYTSLPTGNFNLFENIQLLGISHKNYYKKAFKGEQVDIPEIPITEIGAEGKKRIVKLKTYPLKNPDGSFDCIVILNEDITEQKHAEEELRKVERLKSIGTLAGGIAHDFNNILTGLYGNISLIKEEIAKDHQGFKFLEEAENSMHRAIRLTKQLLTFAKGGEPVKENLCIDRLIKETVSLDLSDNNVILIFDQAKNLWPAKVDKGQIQQVFSQLAINAKQAMPDGGRLNITLKNNEIPADNSLNIRQGKYLKITVKDDGPGIAPNHLDKIFDPYFTTKQKDSGLGLATAYSIINKHGGHISVASDIGMGTTFTLYLPASSRQTIPAAETIKKYVSIKKNTGKILVMDDEMIIRTLTTRILERAGYSAATAKGGKQAIAMYKQAVDENAPFDAVIMDLTIPGGIGGKDAVREILSINPNALCIVSSGYADDPVMANYTDYGFKDAVAKPYTVGELKDTLQRVLEKGKN